MTTDIKYWGSIDRDPERTRRDVLHVLANASGSMRRRAIQGEVFGDLYGASQTIQALRWLEDHQFAARFGRDSRRWVITDAGRLAVQLDDELRSA